MRKNFFRTFVAGFAMACLMTVPAFAESESLISQDMIKADALDAMLSESAYQIIGILTQRIDGSVGEFNLHACRFHGADVRGKCFFKIRCCQRITVTDERGGTVEAQLCTALGKLFGGEILIEFCKEIIFHEIDTSVEWITMIIANEGTKGKILSKIYKKICPGACNFSGFPI